MFTKILVFAVSVITVSSSDHHYAQQIEQHEPPKEYKYPYDHQIRIQEPSSEEYTPEHHGHAYSSQSVLHQGQTAAYEESHQTNLDHEAPVYQYHVNENAEEQTPIQKYRPVHYPSHQVQTIRVPAHHKTPAYYQSHEVSHKPTYYQPDSHEVQHQTDHQYQPESHEVPPYHAVSEHQTTPEHYAIPAHAIEHNAVPEHQVISHDAVPEHHAIEHNAVPEHHAIPVSHHVAESHDEPIDYYAYPKYQYEYKVEDPHTGDNKFQHEFRDGDVVKGIYGLHEPDGSIRTVEYSSDKHHGFTAIVKHSAPGQHVHIESHHPSHE